MQLHTRLTKSLDSYELRIAPMDLSDVPQLHELSVSVAWPHRPEDWELVIRHGQGIVVRDDIERLVGSAMWFNFGETHAGIGMVITSPRLQEHGAGRWMMDHVMEQTGDRGLVLNATRAAQRLYLSLGFMPLSPVFQHNGEVVAHIVREDIPAIRDGRLRDLEPSDRQAVLALDAEAFGLERQPILSTVFDMSHGIVLERQGRICAFALCRKFGRGHVIGPVVAETESDVIALVAPIVEGHYGRFLRMDTRLPSGPLRRFLVKHGLVHHDTVTRMAFGRALPAPSGAARTFGLLNQALG